MSTWSEAGPRSVEEHAAAVAALLPPTGTETVPLAEASGRVLAADVTAGVALPPFDNSAMDGYAVRAAELAGASDDAPLVFPVAADIPAGRVDVPPLAPGTVARIMTGAPVPEGADAIVPVERTDAGTERVRVSAAPEAGAFVRRAGEDTVAGAVLLHAGTVLGAPQIGLAAAVGRPVLEVRRRPHVLVLSTGSELVAPGEPLAPGQIYESNGTMLAVAVREAGATAELLSFVPDDVERFRSVLAERVNGGVDLVLTSGGVSAGAYEVVKDAMTGHGVEFGKVAMQPGGPQGCGRLELGGVTVAVATLPGNPVSSMVSFEAFVRPALRAAAGHPQPARPVVTARLAGPMSSIPGRRQFRRGLLDAASGTVSEVGASGSHLIAALARADCLIDLPADVESVGGGEPVAVWLLDG
ncbi:MULTISPECIES: gephyrin-like molybdotransferase Glp [unclassified Pseudonocardia]|uniref:molybdopterin molybdotransferase MoeA n=1 Tax=unclassified Pseudonocardia TaxID=2619320 RepID=UPI0001FFDAA9|nr:gephyrin-like molybdotransferase Glp [Pseudonocardia sp. Ae707_Ps1]OLM21052.1 Molybdopterin biosynthesis protein MoeA [Pseudonocardia sp. Ae707_Ps1]